jgi:DNA-binding response OmpR family regulator
VEVELGLTQMMEREVRCSQEQAERRARAEADEEPTTAGQEATRRILVVDDDSASLAAAENTLRLQNYQVDTFQDPSRAITAFRECSYDLVLADRSMPRIDGLELTVRLRELAGIEKLPIVLVDDRGSDAHQRAALEAGASAYLSRPLVWSDVGETLEDLLEHVAERRFTRFPLHLSVQPESVAGAGTEMAEDVARGGMRLRTRREIFPGTVEVYKITLPRPLEPVRVEGEVRYRTAQPGQAAILVGVHFRRFIGKCEARWIRLIEALAKREAD